MVGTNYDNCPKYFFWATTTTPKCRMTGHFFPINIGLSLFVDAFHYYRTEMELRGLMRVSCPISPRDDAMRCKRASIKIKWKMLLLLLPHCVMLHFSEIELAQQSLKFPTSHRERKPSIRFTETNLFISTR